MTEMEKALYADAVWLKGRLDWLRAASTEQTQSAARQEVICAADELQATLRKYFGSDL